MSEALELFAEELPFETKAKKRLIVPSAQADKLRKGGAECLDDFISPTEEAELLHIIDQQKWMQDLRRRVQHYGYRYDYKKRNITEDDRIGALPDWVQPICDRLLEQNIFATPPEQMIVNEYEAGQGIASHADRDCFGGVVASLSLGSDCMMDITPYPEDRNSTFAIVLARRSLLALRGVSRDRWLHGIRPNRSDTQDGIKIPRTRRISLTFRTINK